MEQKGDAQRYVSINNYVSSVANPYGLLRTLGEVAAERDAYGEVKLRSGNNAVAFKVMRGEQTLLMKCYIKQRMHSEEIYSFLERQNDPLLMPARLLSSEIYVYDLLERGSYHDVVVAEWAEGNTLDIEIRRAGREFGAVRFAELSQSFERLAYELLEREWAHGDVKPENIVVRPDGSMVLIDYDAMFIPSLAGESTMEIGTPTYQHPLRDQNMFDKHIDDYSIALIMVSLRALAFDDTLFERYNNSDNIILYPQQIIDGTSEAFAEILSLFATHGLHSSYGLALFLNSPTPYVPKLKEAIFMERHPQEADPKRELNLVEYRGSWGYINNEGGCAIAPIYTSATEFSEGVAVVELQGIHQIIDTSGKVVIKGCFDTIKPFSGGVAAIEINGKWGYIARDGEVVIQPRFDDASTMHEGVAAVKLQDKWGYVDMSDRLVIGHIYDHALGFRNARAVVYRDGVMVEIDHLGDILE